jgi:hypothetical protein
LRGGLAAHADTQQAQVDDGDGSDGNGEGRDVYDFEE